MKQSFLRASSRSRAITEQSNFESQRTTPSIRPAPIQQPPTIQLIPSASSRTTHNTIGLQTPVISTEFMKRSLFDRLDDGLGSSRIAKSYNNIPPIQATTALTERVKSIGDYDTGKLHPVYKNKMHAFGKKRAAHSVERTKKSSIIINEFEAKDTEAEREARAEEERRMRYTKLMMFIPKNLESLSVANQHKPSFISFNEIAKTTKTTHPGMIEDLITRSATLRGDSRDRVIEPLDQLDIVKNILKFNKLQKAQYIEQTSETERKLTPLKGVAKHRKVKSKTPIRIVPSRRLHEPMYDMMEEKTDNQSVLPSSPEKVDTAPTESSQREISLLKAMTMGIRASSPTEDYALVNMGLHNYKFFWYALGREKGLFRPDAREGHTLTAVGRYVILYGGLGNRLLDKIAVYDAEDDTWTQPDVKGEVPMAGRHSHSACEYKGHVVFFGGELKFNPTLGLRECLNDIHLFNPDRSEWKYIKAIGKIDPRRNHAAAVYDKFMYVHGGITTEGTFMKDIWAYNFKANQWGQLFPTGGKDPGVAYHTMCACFNEKKDREKYKIMEEGIYVFGGKDEDGKILDTLKILSMSGKTCEWKYPAIKGPAPTARYNHVMLWYRPLQLLLIHGGRNEHNLDQMCLNDIRVLHLESMTWATSSGVGHVPKIGRSNHGAALIRSHIIIFGGVGFCEYANPDLRQVEINQLTTRRLMKEFAEPEERIETSASPKTRRYVETLEESKDEVSIETKDKDFISFQPLPLKQQFPLEESLKSFRKAVKQTIFLNIAKKLSSPSK